MKTPKLKARRMWANYKTTTSHPRVFRSAADCRGDNEWTDHHHVAVPVAVIPLDDVDELIATAVAASLKSHNNHEDSIRAVLVTVGVLPRARKGLK